MEASDLPNRKRNMHSLQSEVTLDETSLIVRQGGLERILHFQPHQVTMLVHGKSKVYHLSSQIPWHAVTAALQRLNASTSAHPAPVLIGGLGGTLSLGEAPWDEGPGQLEFRMEATEESPGAQVETKLSMWVPSAQFEPLAREWAAVCQAGQEHSLRVLAAL